MPRRKKVVESSDEEYDAPTRKSTRKASKSTVKKPPKSPDTPKGSIQAAFARASTKDGTASPTKPIRPLTLRPSSNTTPKKNGSQPSSQNNSPADKRIPKSKAISSFFNSVTQRQSSRPSASPDKHKDNFLESADDIIDDVIDDDVPAASTNTFGRKRKSEAIDDGQNGSGIRQGSQKFLKTNGRHGSLQSSQLKAAQQEPTITQKRPWTDQYTPVNLEELAIHPRKVKDVQTWLENVVSGKERKRLLVLKGGAGTGKTTTVKLLSEKLRYNVTEWRNPDSAGGQGVGNSLAAQFEEFVARTSVFGTLSFEESRSEKPLDDQNGQPHLILVEEFPNTYSTSSSALQGFRTAVLRYLTSATPSMDDFFNQPKETSPVPIIMIISESLLTTTTASSDSFTAHRLLGPDILNHAGTSVIEFNPVAATYMAKALDLILKKEAKTSGRRFAPGPAVLKHISETGDIRSAVSALEFFCLHHGNDIDWSGKIQSMKAKKGVVPAITAMEKQSLEMITQRENTLGIFHAVGRVVYNKRDAPSATDTPPPQPPAWLPQNHRTKVSEVDVDGLLNELGTDISVFVSALHENYVLSCSGLTEEDTLDSVNGCLDSLSDSDLLSPDRFGNSSSRYVFAGTTTDSLRQDEISFEASVRGMLFNLPHPVKRSAPPQEYVSGRGKTGKGTTAFQMLYPTSLRLWRKKDQIESLLDSFNEKFRKGHFDEEMKARGKQQQTLGGVDTWRSRAQFSKPSGQGTEQEEESNGILRGSSKSELLLERLPYFSLIERRKPRHAQTSFLDQLNRVVRFSGMMSILASEEEEVTADAGSGEQWSTDKPSDEVVKKKVGLTLKEKEAQSMVEKNIEKLILSDDDIEDDDT